MRNFKNILITGGAGFIGSNFIHYLFNDVKFEGNVINVDKLTYAGNLENLKEISDKYLNTKYHFEQLDICDFNQLKTIFTKYDIDCVIHFAAESHVDRSITNPHEFIFTNIIGTFNLLECSKLLKKDNFHFHHISTDEVYGSVDTGYFYETTKYDPSSPYSASKASSDHLVKSYFHTFNVPVTISNCSNNYGPFQFPEKLLPLMISNMIEGKSLPIYGDGKNIRDWLYVKDHCSGIWNIVLNGKVGETYNIGGENEWTNIDLVNNLCETVALNTEKEKDYYKKLIIFVKDRKGHDKRYAINCDKIKKELNWKQSVTFEEGLNLTVKWYLNNKKWIENIKTGEYHKI